MIYVHTLGTASIDVGSSTITPTSPRKFALLLHLAAERGRRIPRSALQELIFPNQRDRNARHSLRELVYQLRQLGADIGVGSDGLGLEKNQVCFDFEALLDMNTLGPDHIRSAAAGFLPGFAPIHSETFAEWLDAFRAQSVNLLTRALIREAIRARNAGDWEATENAARACLVLDPLNEKATYAVAEMRFLAGSTAEATRLLDAYAEEVGQVSPDLKLSATMLRRRMERLQRSGSPRMAPRFVGRGEEMSKLRAAVSEMELGRAQVLVVSGEPGIGKSRLVSEFRSLAEIEGIRCVGVAMQPHDAARPMGAFVDLVPQLLRLPGSLGSSPESMAALRRLTGGISREPEPQQEVDLDSIASAVSIAIGDLCESIAAETPLALLIEDAHSIDQFSLNVLSALVSNRRNARIVVVLTTREARPLLLAFKHLDCVTSLALSPLAADVTGTLIDDALSMLRPPPSDTRARLVDLANGNPLFALSLANHYRETGDGLGVPVTLIDSIGRRVDTLSTEALSVLTACIALGKHYTTDRLLRSLDLNTISLLKCLGELDGVGIMTGAIDQGAGIHPLVAEVVSIRSLPAGQQIVNARVAEVFEHDAREGGSPAYWWEAGTLWRRSGNSNRALAAYRACAKHAMDIGRPADAAHILNEALVVGSSDQLTIAAARELMVAADLSSETGIVLRGYSILAGAGGLASHDEFELAARRALIRETELPDQVFELTLRCIKDPHATPEHRVLAATLGLKGAEVGETADRMVLMLLDELPASDLNSVEDVIRLEFELLVRAVKDDWEGACIFATQLMSAAEAKRPARQASILHNCGIAFSLGGKPNRAIEAWQRAYEIVVGARTPSQQGRVATLLAGIHADLANDTEWDFWIARAAEAFERSPGYKDSFDLAVIQMCRALVAGDFDRFESLVLRTGESGAFQGSPTRDRWGKSLHLFLRTIRGTLSAEDVAAARALFQPDTRIFSGIRDFEIAAAAGILALQEPEATLQAIHRYLVTERRTRQLLDRLLSVAIERLEGDVGRTIEVPAFQTERGNLPETAANRLRAPEEPTVAL